MTPQMPEEIRKLRDEHPDTFKDELLEMWDKNPKTEWMQKQHWGDFMTIVGAVARRKFRHGFDACYELMSAEVERLKEVISYLPKVPTQPYEKELAQKCLELEKENAHIRQNDETSCRAYLAEVEFVEQLREKLCVLEKDNARLTEAYQNNLKQKLELESYIEKVLVPANKVTAVRIPTDSTQVEQIKNEMLEAKLTAQSEIISKYEHLVVKMKGFGYAGIFPVEQTVSEVAELKKKGNL